MAETPQGNEALGRVTADVRKSDHPSNDELLSVIKGHEGGSMERPAAKLDPAFRRQLLIDLESIMNLVYLAKVKTEDGTESKRYWAWPTNGSRNLQSSFKMSRFEISVCCMTVIARGRKYPLCRASRIPA